MNGTQTLGRALDILFVLADVESTLSVAEIAEKVSIPESTAYRLLQTLEQNGIVERKAKGQVGLGLRILELARSLTQQIDRDLYIIARPIMEKLTEATNETSSLMVRTGTNIICIQHVESRRLIRFAIENGRILPLLLGASGKAILAFESKRVIEQMMSLVVNKAEYDQLAAELAQIQQQGYCKTIGEVDRDVFGIAAPIYDTHQRVIASLTIAGPAERLSNKIAQEFIAAVMEAAEQISQKLAR